MDQNLRDLASRCLGCIAPRCEAFCPAANAIVSVLSLLKLGKEEEAAAVLYEANPFPELTSVLCDHARQCKGHCVRGLSGDPVDFPSVEKRLRYLYPRPLGKKRENGRSIALVGAGPANLALGYYLLRQGYRVAFFEKEESIGGAILTGIPSFRFDKSALKGIYEDLLTLGASFSFNTSIGETNPLSALFSSFDRVVLGVGASKENLLSFPKAKGIIGGLSYLSEGEKKEPLDHVYVMGGGNVALDCARLAKRRHGNATILYRRDEASMPASRDEIEAAIQDGVVLCPLKTVQDVVIKNDALAEIVTISMSLGEVDASGRRSPKEIPGSEETLPANKLILATGEKPDLAKIDPRLASFSGPMPIEGLFLNGDCAYGAKNIARAIKSAKEVFQAIEESF